MEFKNFTYLLLLMVSMIVPLIYTFEKELKFFIRLRYLLPAIFITAALFIYWDFEFVKGGIWSFNPEYTLGIKILNLPVEECLFFFIIPYSLSFINEVLRFKTPELVKPMILVALSFVLLVLFAFIAWENRERLYTYNNFLFLTLFMGYVIFRNRYRDHFYWFYATWIISLLPFAIFNGILTYLPVVEYNSAHITGIKTGSIPVEDFAYLFLLYLVTDTLYRFLEERRFW